MNHTKFVAAPPISAMERIADLERRVATLEATIFGEGFCPRIDLSQCPDCGAPEGSLHGKECPWVTTQEPHIKVDKDILREIEDGPEVDQWGNS